MESKLKMFIIKPRVKMDRLGSSRSIRKER